MKIAIAVEEKSMEINVCPSFGRSPYFLIYDLEAGKGEFIVNGAANSQGGAGIKASQTIVDQKVEAVLVPRLGKNSADILNAAGIKIYKSQDGSVTQNIELYKDGKLEILDSIHPGFHNHGN